MSKLPSHRLCGPFTGSITLKNRSIVLDILIIRIRLAPKQLMMGVGIGIVILLIAGST